jgi:hypothetical protein
VEQLYARARELCEQVGEPPELFRVLWGLWGSYNAHGEQQTMQALGEQLLSLAERLHDPDLLLEAHHALWTSLFTGGELMAARAHQEEGLLPISELALAEGICYTRGPLGCHPMVVDGEARAGPGSTRRAGCCGKTAVLLNA